MNRVLFLIGISLIILSFSIRIWAEIVDAKKNHFGIKNENQIHNQGEEK